MDNINNCENCGASYSPYNVETEGYDDQKEFWCELPVLNKSAKGLCQFCNPKSKFYDQTRDKKTRQISGEEI